MQNDRRNTRDTIYFFTANSEPSNAIAKLSETFPNLKLKLTFCDMESDGFIGKFVFSKGVAIEFRLYDDEPCAEATELFAEFDSGK